MSEIIDCQNCGRHYESEPTDDLHDIKERIAATGFCCDYCEQEARDYELLRS